MNKVKLLIATLLSAIFLASCGGDMKDWPYVNLDISIENASYVYIDYQNREDDSLSYQCYSNQVDTINGVHNYLESFHVSEKIYSKDVSDFNRKFTIYFVFDDNSIYDFKAYYYSGATTYFMYNDELRFFSADFGSSMNNYIERHTSEFTFY